MTSAKYIETLMEEKSFDLEERFEVEGMSGPNSMTYQIIVDAILGAGEMEQDGIADMLRRIDFKNGDVRGYLRHLAQAIAI